MIEQRKRHLTSYKDSNPQKENNTNNEKILWIKLSFSSGNYEVKSAVILNTRC